jgi:uncharacterized protein (DUF1501 family)
VLRGAGSARAVASIEAFRFGRGDTAAEADALYDLYRPREGAGLAAKLADAGRGTLDVLARLESVQRSSTGARYPDHAFGRALADVAALVRAKVGLEVACVDLGNWDSHFLQARLLPDLADALGRGLAAFRDDLGDMRRAVDVVVMTEFGRRSGENGSLGTDHGHGSVMLLLGDAIGDATVSAKWPGLSPSNLVGPGDLAVTTDYRDVLAELLTARFGNSRTSEVFPRVA